MKHLCAIILSVSITINFLKPLFRHFFQFLQFQLLNLCSGQSLSPEECKNLGFIKSDLLCSSCDDLARFKVSSSITSKQYSKSIIEVPLRLWLRYVCNVHIFLKKIRMALKSLLILNFTFLK